MIIIRAHLPPSLLSIEISPIILAQFRQNITVAVDAIILNFFSSTNVLNEDIICVFEFLLDPSLQSKLSNPEQPFQEGIKLAQLQYIITILNHIDSISHHCQQKLFSQLSNESIFTKIIQLIDQCPPEFFFMPQQNKSLTQQEQNKNPQDKQNENLDEVFFQDHLYFRLSIGLAIFSSLISPERFFFFFFLFSFSFSFSLTFSSFKLP